MPQPADPCPPEALSELVSVVGRDSAQGLAQTDALLRDYPGDARLHFLRGSLLAGQERYGEARQAMASAVELAPTYWVARFQLGFLQLTSGDAVGAEATWGPMSALPDDYYLALFVRGLHHLIGDEFAPAVHFLSEGVRRNLDNAPMNHDMQLIIDALNRAPPEAGEPISATHLLLRHYAGKTKH